MLSQSICAYLFLETLSLSSIHMLHYCAKSSALQTPYLTRLWAYLTFTSVLGKRVRISDLDQAPTWCLAWFLFGIGGNALGISELAAVVGRRDSKFRKHYYATLCYGYGTWGTSRCPWKSTTEQQDRWPAQPRDIKVSTVYHETKPNYVN